MRLLIAGAGGFLGSHILAEFSSSNINILSPTSKQLNILNFDCLYDYLYKYRPDTILHCAAKCGGILSNHNSPADFLRDNTQMGLNIYEAARMNNITNIYSLGSVCAYPVNCPTPFREDDIWNGAAESTNFPYGQSKRTLLMLGQTYRQQYRFTGAHLIPVNMYGERDNFDLTNSHVIPALIRKFLDAKNNLQTVECWGDGSATREFLYAGDCAQAIVKAVMTGLNTDLPINIGVGKDISIKNLATLIAELTGYEGDIVFTGEVSNGQMKRLLDVSRARELLNWEATTTLRDGLIKTIDWYKSNM